MNIVHLNTAKTLQRNCHMYCDRCFTPELFTLRHIVHCSCSSRRGVISIPLNKTINTDLVRLEFYFFFFPSMPLKDQTNSTVMKPAVDEMFPEGAGPYVDLDEVSQLTGRLIHVLIKLEMDIEWLYDYHYDIKLLSNYFILLRKSKYSGNCYFFVCVFDTSACYRK